VSLFVFFVAVAVLRQGWVILKPRRKLVGHMNKLALTLLMTACVALTVLSGGGCSDDEYPQPRVAKIYASESCGVVPLRVDFRAEVTGGEPYDDPTGGNSWLKLTWDFGDGTVHENGSSVAYHLFETPGVRTVTVTAEDAGGKRASQSLMVTINPDTMTVTAFAHVLGDTAFALVDVPTCYPMPLDFSVETCGFNPLWDSYDRFIPRWSLGDEALEEFYPTLVFYPEDVTDEPIAINLTVEDPGQSIFRHTTLNIVPDDQFKADLHLSNDWWLSEHPDYTGGDTLVLGEDEKPSIEEMPVYFTYTVRLYNDGDYPAYGVSVVGNLHQHPGNNRHAMYVGSQPSTGTVSFFTEGPPGTRIKEWTWTVPIIGAHSVETIDVTFRNEDLPGAARFWPAIMDFDTEIVPYPCDVDPRPCEELEPDEECKWTTRATLQRLWN
jgi:PKD repeat protein